MVEVFFVFFVVWFGGFGFQGVDNLGMAFLYRSRPESSYPAFCQSARGSQPSLLALEGVLRSSGSRIVRSYLGVSENRGPYFCTLNSRILIMWTQK